MTAYIPLKDYGKNLGLKKGDFILVSTDSRRMIMNAIKNNSSTNFNDFIDGLLEEVGSEGTVVFPCYNWDFCKGEPFDYRTTPSKTGSITQTALSRSDFKRTKHPIYSFAVSGRYQKELVDLNNQSSFGSDSPFDFFRHHNAVNLIFDVKLERSFTYVHYVQEVLGDTSNRYQKYFTADYTDENGITSRRTYSMFVRKLELDVKNLVDPLEEDFIKAGCISYCDINASKIKKIDLNKCYDSIVCDIKYNKSRKLCSYKGQ